MSALRRLALWLPEGAPELPLQHLAAWATHFSPLVEPVAPATLLIDITGCQQLFGGEANLARQAATGLQEQGFSVRVAIADTVGAAYALASAGHEPLVIVPPGQTSAYLAPLAPAALRIEPRAATRLAAVGVRTIGDLLMLPRSSLPARFGVNLVLRLQQALGEIFEGVATYQAVAVPHARIGFEESVRELPAIQAVAGRLLTRVFEQLQRQDLALRQLDCVLYYERMSPITLTVGLSRPSRSREHTEKLLVERLAQTDVSPGVCGLLLAARETARWQASQVDLFEPREPEEEEKLGSLVDRLASRLGDRAILRPQLLDDYQPERAFRLRCVAQTGLEAGPTKNSGSDGTATEPPLAAGPPANLRPVRLLARPVPIRVIAVVPDGPPTWIAYNGREYAIAGADGPERLETGWWRGPDVRRDYFRVRTTTGEQFWIFHALNEGDWYLHGVFA